MIRSLPRRFFEKISGDGWEWRLDFLGDFSWGLEESDIFFVGDQPTATSIALSFFPMFMHTLSLSLYVGSGVVLDVPRADLSSSFYSLWRLTIQSLKTW